MISYFKTQWFRVLCGLICIVIALVLAFSPSLDTSTLEGTNNCIGLMFASTSWFLAGFLWFGISIMAWHADRIALLETKAKKYDALVEKVDALAALFETERKYVDHLHRMIESVIETMEDTKHGN